MQTFVDLALVFCFNTIIVATAAWATLRVVEKGYDIILKDQQYEKNKEASE